MTFPAARPPRGPRRDGSRRAELRSLAPFHRLVQFGLGLLATRHPAVTAVTGTPATWAPLHRVGGGLVLSGPEGRVMVVPTARGAYCLNRGAPEVARAVDDIVDCLLDTWESAAAAALPGKEGNALARGVFYLAHDVPEGDFVRAYLTFVRYRPGPPLDDLFAV